MTARVFVDTNVLLYARDVGDPTRQAIAIGWLAALWRDRTGRTSMQVLSEYYVNVTRKLKPGLPRAQARDDLDDLMAWQPHPIDAPLVQRALDIETRHMLSWWDALIVAAAQVQDCAILLTEDLHDGAVFGKVTVKSPFSLSVQDERAAYVTQAAAPLHRSRGRPRLRPVRA